MHFGEGHAEGFRKRDASHPARSGQAAADLRPTPDGPGVPRGRVIDEGDGGGARALSEDGTKPIGGRKNHPGSPPFGAS